MKEIFKEVNDYPEYQVSNFGNVKSLKYGKELILKLGESSNGYLYVGLSEDKIRKTLAVHKLVAIAFLNHEPLGYKITVDHIDNDKHNNRLYNLQLISQRENISKYHYSKKTSSKYLNVSWIKKHKRWRVAIRIKGKSIHVGNYTCELEANKVAVEFRKKMNYERD